jgi:tetratricopeptide (TPR) repeat protein
VLKLLPSLAAGSLLIPLLGAGATDPADSPQPVRADATPAVPDPLRLNTSACSRWTMPWPRRWIAGSGRKWPNAARASALSDVTLRARILDRFRPVRQAYEDFLTRHPRHARGHLAFGSFLNEIGEEELAVEHMEKSRELDPANPAAWNNLANHYGHRGPVRKAFEYYAQAIELNPKEPVYYQNLAVAVYLYSGATLRRSTPWMNRRCSRKRSSSIAKPCSSTRKTLCSPPNTPRVSTACCPGAKSSAPSHAEKTRQITDRAIEAWQAALALAQDDLQRQGVLIHLARNRFLSGRYDEAAADLVPVTHEALQTIKSRIQRNIDNGRGSAP